MCLACQMEDELWFAYLDQVAQQQKASAADAAAPANSEQPEKSEQPERPAARPAPSSPFACDELPSE